MTLRLIVVISMARYLTDKGEHTALYKDKKNVYTKTPKIILYSHIVLNTHTRTDARTHSRSYARTHACTHARTHTSCLRRLLRRKSCQEQVIDSYQEGIAGVY